VINAGDQGRGRFRARRFRLCWHGGLPKQA
jgi:hypothetical protein